MEWIIKTEGFEKRRIRIQFDPKTPQLIYIAEYKPKNEPWIEILRETTDSMETVFHENGEVNLDEILSTLHIVNVFCTKILKMYDKLSEPLKALSENGVRMNDENLTTELNPQK